MRVNYKHWVAVELGDERPDTSGEGRLTIPAPIVRRLTRHTTRRAAINAAKRAGVPRERADAEYQEERS